MRAYKASAPPRNLLQLRLFLAQNEAKNGARIGSLPYAKWRI
jgi:hypothetical protein